MLSGIFTLVSFLHIVKAPLAIVLSIVRSQFGSSSQAFTAFAVAVFALVWLRLAGMPFAVAADAAIIGAVIVAGLGSVSVGP